MIHKETWHKEAELFEGQIRQLMEEAQRGLVTPEEFMTRMLRFYKSEFSEGEDDAYLLEHMWNDPTYPLETTQAWFLAHSSTVQSIMAELTAFSEDPWDGYYKFIVDKTNQFEKFPQGWDERKAMRVVNNMNSLYYLFKKPGARILILDPPYFVPRKDNEGDWITEREFTEWARQLPQQIRNFRNVWK